MKGIFALSLSLMMGAFSENALHAQTGASTSSGVYTAGQAGRGHTLYSAQCASCHLDDLTGSGQNPPLSGDSFIADWNGQTLADLFDKIRATMPADHPGTLSSQQTADVLAFILSANKFPTGKTELPIDAAHLKQIHIDKPQPDHVRPPAPPKN